MQHKWYNATEIEVGSNSKQIFYMETIEVSRLSALAFFAAGETNYKGKRYYWQNREKTFTLVGLGHAYIIENNEGTKRFDAVEAEWKNLTSQIVQEDQHLQPILFGGFTFDPQNEVTGEWVNFPQSYFTVATHQLVIRNDQAFVTINFITNQENSAEVFETLRKERDALIHAAQVKELKTYHKPTMPTISAPRSRTEKGYSEQLTVP